MAETKREIERKYEADTAEKSGLPDLSGITGVATVRDEGTDELDAVYYDTQDLRLAACNITLRRRTGGSDAGWHLKLPVAEDVRDEIHAPLGDTLTLPGVLRDLVRARTRDAALIPVVRLVSTRELRHLLDASDTLLAEVSLDRVVAERLTDGGNSADWTEIEVELAAGGDPKFLDKVAKKLRKGLGSLRRAESPSKLARALAETGQGAPAVLAPPSGAVPGTAGGEVMAYLRAQYETILSRDAGVRRGVPDSVHRMRVAIRRSRSVLRSHRSVLDRNVTDPLRAELKWLAGELGVDRDQEVLDARLRGLVAAVPGPLLLGPVDARLTVWSVATSTRSSATASEALGSARYLTLLAALEEFLTAPPLRPAAHKSPAKVLPKAVAKDHGRLTARMDHARSLPEGEERTAAMHEARKAAKRARYTAEAARPALGKPAKRYAKRAKALQSLLGEHHDSKVTREALRTLAVQAHGSGETAFTWGLLYGREEQRAAEYERELPGVWGKVASLKPERKVAPLKPKKKD
ncbi:CYTH and CHAD domain-containing protein [Streptomyces tsukubensis]|uniref:Metal-binding protein n=1 Tax=Streptomyces tsukubensis TaxID=83656 RepID=A0A1V4AC15_9ACTN|nr:CYTH and CHAD domain-containing protein [Streptomyces tsukubensis]OON80799.1 metal-binding protein [Streptomyces tsukubensis]QFR93561.1 CHAD domain-containing protein [Streptomyces tsukubensis]